MGFKICKICNILLHWCPLPGMHQGMWHHAFGESTTQRRLWEAELPHPTHTKGPHLGSHVLALVHGCPAALWPGGGKVPPRVCPKLVGETWGTLWSSSHACHTVGLMAPLTLWAPWAKNAG
jgi:hypothetical protein